MPENPFLAGYFKNRSDAGDRLLEELKRLHITNPDVVIAIPNGGVSVAQPIAEHFGKKLSIVTAKKIVFPPIGKEIAFGAVSQQGRVVYDEDRMEEYGLTKEFLQPYADAASDEVSRLVALFKPWVPKEDLSNSEVLVVDDGAATGLTQQAVIEYLKLRNPKRITLAFPVAPENTIRKLKTLVQKVVYLVKSNVSDFSVGYYYIEFPQLNDKETLGILKKYP